MILLLIADFTAVRAVLRSGLMRIAERILKAFPFNTSVMQIDRCSSVLVADNLNNAGTDLKNVLKNITWHIADYVMNFPASVLKILIMTVHLTTLR